MATYRWRGDEIWWERVGSGPGLVLCHGTPWSSIVWDRTMDQFANHFTVHRFDLLGFGRSTKREGQDVSLAAQANLLAALLDHWQLDRPNVIAHDIGGAVALGALLRHDAAFASLTLVDVVALAPWGSPFFSLVGDHEDVFQQLPAPMHRALLDAYVLGAAHRDLPDGTLERLTSPWHGEEGQAAFYRQIAQADQADTDDLEPRYSELDVSVHIIWGARDPWVPVDRAHQLHSRIPGSTLQVIDDVGHLVPLEAADELAAALESVLLADTDRGAPAPTGTG